MELETNQWAGINNRSNLFTVVIHRGGELRRLGKMAHMIRMDKIHRLTGILRKPALLTLQR